MNSDDLIATAQALVATVQGPARDGRKHTDLRQAVCRGRNSPNRRGTAHTYRELLVTTFGLGNCVSGVILYDETIRQCDRRGTLFVKRLVDAGIIPGIKVDLGAKHLALHPGEKVTEGLDGLRGRLQEYSSMGARFAKWRAVIGLSGGQPSRGCIAANADALARYAALCQEAGLVPLVEPEVVMEGDHTIQRWSPMTCSGSCSTRCTIRTSRWKQWF